MSCKRFPFHAKIAFIEEGEERLDKLGPREKNELILSNNVYSSGKKNKEPIVLLSTVFLRFRYLPRD